MNIPQHFTGLILSTIRRALAPHADSLRAYDWRSNAVFGAHQAIIEFDGQEYRMILAPIDAPVTIGGRLADEHFGRHS